MKNIFIAAFIMLFSANAAFVKAQDTVKKPVVKKAVVKPVIQNPTTGKPAIDPATGKPPIPINPKTGRPYTKYGYGAYANNRYDATKAAHKADSIKKAAALKAAPQTTAVKPVAPPVATPPVTTQPAADTTKPAAPADKSLKGQYQYLLTKVYNYQQPFVSAFWKNIIDTMNTSRRNLVNTQAKVAEQDKTITALQADVASAAKADEISLFGITMSKSAYNILMWGLVIVCALAAVIIFARSGGLKNEAVYRTNLYNELEDEFKTYKTKANEKEKKLARELQTERNKVDELMGRS